MGSVINPTILLNKMSVTITDNEVNILGMNVVNVVFKFHITKLTSLLILPATSSEFISFSFYNL